MPMAPNHRHSDYGTLVIVSLDGGEGPHSADSDGLPGSSICLRRGCCSTGTGRALRFLRRRPRDLPRLRTKRCGLRRSFPWPTCGDPCALRQWRQRADAGLLPRTHQSGDWGEVNEEDQQLNDEALIHGDRILSALPALKGVKLVGNHEAADETATERRHNLLPDEYDMKRKLTSKNWPEAVEWQGALPLRTAARRHFKAIGLGLSVNRSCWPWNSSWAFANLAVGTPS